MYRLVDPDMPVRGLRKFLNAASQLFDQQLSTCELLSLNIQEQGHGADDDDVIVARWRMNGVLRLPWKPKMPEVVGTTIYRLDENHLIRLHEETWDISAVEAFFRTKWLDFSNYAGGSYHT